MKDLIVMQDLESKHQMDDSLPNFDLCDELFLFLVFVDCFTKISSFSVLHYYAKHIQVFIEKCFIVLSNVRRIKGG